MRRTQFLIALPALLALFVNSRTASAGNTLSVFPGCFNNGGGVAVCSPSVTGGTGNYVSYSWHVIDTQLGQPTLSWYSTGPEMSYGCRIGGGVNVTLTVTDSQGETGTGTHSIACSEWAD